MSDKHPIQKIRSREPLRLTTDVTMRAYEVYCHVFAPQEALITGDCRGGFGIGELIAFLYAHSFPKEEWKRRVDDAFAGMENFT